MEKIELLENMRILSEDGVFEKEVRRTAIIKIREFSNKNVHSPGKSVKEEGDEMREVREKSDLRDDSDVSDHEIFETEDRDMNGLESFDRRSPCSEVTEINNTNVQLPGTSVEESIIGDMADLREKSNGGNGSDDSNISDDRDIFHISDTFHLSDVSDDSDAAFTAYAEFTLGRRLLALPVSDDSDIFHRSDDSDIFHISDDSDIFQISDDSDIFHLSDGSDISDHENFKTEDRDMNDLENFDRRSQFSEVREINNRNVQLPGTSMEESIVGEMRDVREKSDVSNGSDDSDISDISGISGLSDLEIFEDSDLSDESYKSIFDGDSEDSEPDLDENLHTRFSVYPNGCNFWTKGRVFLECELSHHLLFLRLISNYKFVRFELTCVVNIVDVEGCKRFPQSFMYIQTKKGRTIPKFDYVSRDFLLMAADELLPDDTLTIQVDVVLKASLANCIFANNVIKNFKVKKRNVFLSLNCPLVKNLCAESRYFERLCATPMSEKDSGYVKIPRDELFLFIQLVVILFDQVTLEHRGLKLLFRRILALYRLADFYGIDRVLDTCRRWLKLVCRTSEEASAISDLADEYGDPVLRGIVERAGSKNEDGTEVVQDGVPYEPWTVDIKSDSEGSVYYVFRFSSKSEEEEGRVGHVIEDVSDISNCYI